MIKRGPSRGTRAGEGFDPDVDVDFAGKYPNTMAEIATWTGISGWAIGWNFTSLTSSTVANSCPSMSGGGNRTLIRLEGGLPAAEQAFRAPAPQDGFAAQGGVFMNAVQQMLYVAAPEWTVHSTTPNLYLFRVRFYGPAESGAKHLAGVDGAAGGWSTQSHPTSGIRVLIGNTGAGYVATSYVGGTSLYDGEWHTIALAIDDAAGKAKLICEFGVTESTGLTISSGSALATFGGQYKGDPLSRLFGALFAYRCEHANAYTNSEAIFDAFEAARIAGGA